MAACQRALERTRDYCRQRQIFGKPILANQYIQYGLAELGAEVNLLQAYNHVVATRYDAGQDVARESTIAKFKVGRLHRQVADVVPQIHRGLGYIEETWTARFLRDARLTGIGGGSDEAI